MINLKIPEFYRNMSIRKRLTIFLIIATLVPAILIFLAASIGINKINFDYNKKYMLTSEQMAEENLKSYVERINMTYLNILTDKEFFSILENKDSPDFEDKLNTRLKGLVTDYIQNVDIIDSQKNVIRILNSENVEQLSYETISSALIVTVSVFFLGTTATTAFSSSI